MEQNEGGEDVFDKHPIYDLRQIYAKDLLGRTLIELDRARKIRDYSMWYGLVRWDLYADLYQKLDQKEIEMIESKIEETRKVIARFTSAFLKKSNNPEEHETIMNAIWELEVLMKNLAEEHNIYGTAKEDIGL
jgi:hypothetical protein